MRRLGILSVTCILALFSTKAFANVGQINVTATRTKVLVEKTPSYMSVVTNKRIKENGIIFAKNALTFSPGVNIVSNGAFGGLTSTYIRGLDSYYTKYLLDGVDISDPSSPQPYYNFAFMGTNNINRIEIVQGSQSGLYGSNAIAGVINTITKTGKGTPSVSYKQTIGSFHTYGEYANAQGKMKHTSFYIGLSRFDTNGISKMDRLKPNGKWTYGDERDSFHKMSLYSKIEYDIKNTKIGNITYAYNTINYLDYGFPPNDASPANQTPTAKSYREYIHFIMSKLYVDQRMGKITIKPDIYYVHNFRYYKSLPSVWYNNYFKGKRWGGDLILSYKPFKITTIIAGGSYKKDTVELSSYGSTYYTVPSLIKSEDNAAGFLELFQSIGNANIQIATREDHFSTFGNHFTYKVGTSYLIAPTNTILKANYATGFEAPSLYELYSSYGNDKLDPTKSKSWDMGFVQNIFMNKLSISLDYFKTLIYDRIAFNSTTWKYEQAKGTTTAQGIEGAITLKPIQPLTLGVSYTYTNSQNPNGKQATNIPIYTIEGYATLKTLSNNLTLTLNGKYVGRRYGYGGPKTGNYAVFNVNSIYKINKNLKTTLTVDNIFNKFYQQIYGYSTLPRSAFVSVEYTF